jgi:triosephosphate isomerase
MRKPFIVGNWKMNKTTEEAVTLVEGIKNQLNDASQVDVAVCPVFTVLNSVKKVINDSVIALGAQNLHWEEKGAFTGEISAEMLLDCGCSYVIIGHSERRKYFGETDVSVNRKIKAALKAGLTPIVCVGESLEDREQNKTIDIIRAQLRGAFADLEKDSVKKIVVAYEPVWAIGTGKTATPDQAQEVHKFIRAWLKEHFSEELVDNLRILYGGSVKPANTKELMSEPDIDGALVGGASLKVDSFLGIINNAS